MTNIKNITLHEQVLQYQKTGHGFDRLKQEISLKAYYYPRQKLGWGRDACSDFYLYFIPRLEHILGKFRNKGTPFEHYLNCLMRWQLLTYIQIRKQKSTSRKYEKNHAFWDEPEYRRFDEFYSDRKLDLGQVFTLDSENRIINECDKRQFLYFVLRKSWTINQENLEYISTVTGYELDWLNQVIHKLNLSLDKRMQRLQKFRKRKRSAFFKIRVLEDKLRQEYDPDNRQQLKNKLIKCRLTFIRACNSLGRLQLAPTQQAIADAIGVPRGTVNTAIYQMKKKLLRVSLN